MPWHKTIHDIHVITCIVALTGDNASRESYSYVTISFSLSTFSVGRLDTSQPHEPGPRWWGATLCIPRDDFHWQLPCWSYVGKVDHSLEVSVIYGAVYTCTVVVVINSGLRKVTNLCYRKFMMASRWFLVDKLPWLKVSTCFYRRSHYFSLDYPC